MGERGEGRGGRVHLGGASFAPFELSLLPCPSLYFLSSQDSTFSFNVAFWETQEGFRRQHSLYFGLKLTIRYGAKCIRVRCTYNAVSVVNIPNVSVYNVRRTTLCLWLISTRPYFPRCRTFTHDTASQGWMACVTTAVHVSQCSLQLTSSSSQ